MRNYKNIIKHLKLVHLGAALWGPFPGRSLPVPREQGKLSDLSRGLLRQGQGSAQMKELSPFRRLAMSLISAFPVHSLSQGAFSLASAETGTQVAPT